MEVEPANIVGAMPAGMGFYHDIMTDISSHLQLNGFSILFPFFYAKVGFVARYERDKWLFRMFSLGGEFAEHLWQCLLPQHFATHCVFEIP